MLQSVTVSCRALQCIAACYSVLQGVTVCCRALQCAAGRCSVLQVGWRWHTTPIFATPSVLQCVAVCWSASQCDAVQCRSDEGDTAHVYVESLYVAFGCIWLKCVAVRCSVLQCVAWCSALQYVAGRVVATREVYSPESPCYSDILNFNYSVMQQL